MERVMIDRFILVVVAGLLRNFLLGFLPRQILPRARISISYAMLPIMV